MDHSVGRCQWGLTVDCLGFKCPWSVQNCKGPISSQEQFSTMCISTTLNLGDVGGCQKLWSQNLPKRKPCILVRKLENRSNLQPGVFPRCGKESWGNLLLEWIIWIYYRNYGVYPEEKNTIHSPMVQPRSLGSKPGWWCFTLFQKVHPTFVVHDVKTLGSY